MGGTLLGTEKLVCGCGSSVLGERERESKVREIALEEEEVEAASVCIPLLSLHPERRRTATNLHHPREGGTFQSRRSSKRDREGGCLPSPASRCSSVPPRTAGRKEEGCCLLMQDPHPAPSPFPLLRSQPIPRTSFPRME